MTHMSNSTRTGVAATLLATIFLTAQAHAGGSITLSPANNIQAAINSGLYSEIILQPGNYNQTLVIDAADAPLTLRSTNPADAATVTSTVLDGQFLGTSVILMNSGVGSDVVIDGLTIQNGEAVGAAGPAVRGGAIECELAGPTIRRCVLLNNHADSAGGALYVNGASPTLDDCTFTGNDAAWGGAIYANNSTVNMTRCHFNSNDATNEGGACRLYTGTYTFEQCSFTDNTSVTFGGAIAVRNGAMWSAQQCWFDSNFSGDGGANGRGGAVFHEGSTAAWMENSIFWNNEATQWGASAYISGTTLTLRHTTHYGDVASGGAASVVFSISGGASRLNLHNSIIWAQSDVAMGGAGTQNVTHCNIQGGWPGAGNIGDDSEDTPDFADAAAGDFRLLAGSAGIDAGDAAKVLGEYPVDYDGNPRALDDPDTADSGVALLGIAVDMGAFEFQPSTVVPPDPCPADLNDDGVINVIDLLELLTAWGGC